MPPRRRTLRAELRRRRPDLADPDAAIAAGRVEVGGRPVTNPASQVLPTDPIVVAEPAPLRGRAKLAAGLDAFGVAVDGRVALDVGAAAGGFTEELLDRGARRVYALDAGHGQLRGHLRQDPRVVDLEGTNVAELDDRLVPDAVDVITIDVSYLAVAACAPQLARVRLAPGADLVALVKPMFELRLGRAPTVEDPGAGEQRTAAVGAATAGLRAAGWEVVASAPSPVTGGRGALEALLHARR